MTYSQQFPWFRLPFIFATFFSVVAPLLFPTQVVAECGPGSTPPTANLSLIEENEEGWAKLQIAHTGFEFGGFAWHYRQQGDGWFAGRPPSPNVWSLDITCMDVPELVILDGAGCEPVHRELSVGPYDYTPSLAVVGMSNCGTGDCRTSARCARVDRWC